MGELPHEIHNRVGLEVTERIVKESLACRGSPDDTLLMLESINIGVFLMIKRITGMSQRDLEAYVGAVFDGVEQRVKLDGKPEGRA